MPDESSQPTSPHIADPRTDLSDWLHDELKAHYDLETEPWARERVARVMATLNAQRAGQPALEAVILWVPDLCAFTAVGKYIYISRRLLERLPSDDAAAFIFAHEIGHHDCHHLQLFSGWTDWMPHVESVGYLAAVVRLLEHKAYGPEREAEADLFAMELCIKAGYDGQHVLQALAILENEMLDRGDVSGVFGPENLLDPTDPDANSMSYRLQRWVWTHSHGYLPLHERYQRAREWLTANASQL